MIRCTPNLIRCLASALGLGIAIGVVASCGGDTAVRPPEEVSEHPSLATVGDTLSGSLTTAEPHKLYYFHRTGSADLVFLATASGGDVEITVNDSASGRLVMDWTVANGSAFASTVSPLISPDTGTYELGVKTLGNGAVTYRVHIHALGEGGPPEHAAATIAIGAVIDDEALDDAVDVDDYSFDAAAGDEFIVYAQGRAPADTDRFVVDVTLPGTASIATRLTATGNDPDPESHASGRLMVPSAGVVHIRVAAYTDPFTRPRYTGAYRLEVARIDRAPEQHEQAITPGDTVVGESIDRVGDVDEFTLKAQQGEEYKIFFQAARGPASNALRLEVSGLPSGIASSVTSIGTDTLLLAERATSTFRIPASGSYAIRVTGVGDHDELNRGAYRLFVYRIDRHPEQVSVAHVVGDTIAGERLELPGDVDEFTLTNPTATLFNMEAWRMGGSGTSPLTVTLQPAGGGTPLTTANVSYPYSATSESGVGSGRILLPAGSYTVQVSQGGYGTGYWGPYRIVFDPIDSLPEGHAVAIAVGDTIEGAVEPAGDLDPYTLAVKRGGHYDVYFQGTGPEQGAGPELLIQTGQTVLGGVTGLSGSGPTLLTSSHTQRLDAEQDDVWHLTAKSGNDGTSLAEHGPYRFVVVPVSSAVEHHAATIAVGDIVSDEALDSPGDIDEFTLAGSPGDEDIIHFMSTGELAGISIEVFDLDTKEIVCQMHSFGAKQATGRFRIPSSGQIGVRVMEPRAHDPIYHSYSWQGPYWMAVIGVDRAPETTPGTFAIGDTVSGETIYPTGDVDEFTFTGTAGERLRAFFDMPHGSSAYLGLHLEVSPAGSDSALGSVEIMNPAPALDVGTDVITLPTTGTYVVRVRQVEERLVADATEYRFQLRLEP